MSDSLTPPQVMPTLFSLCRNGVQFALNLDETVFVPCH